jgi:phospholipid/cholesterol/gamma-HCH transport system substrate-binding protein
MPRTRSLAWSELKIGVLTIVAITIAIVLIFMLTGSSGFFWQRYPLKTRLNNVAGLAPGSPVRVAGKQVGSVKEVEFAGEQVDVIFEVNKELRPLVTTSSSAKLGSVSLLGEGAIDITPSSKGESIPDWGYVPTGKPPAQISDITDQAFESIGEVTAMLRDVRQGRGTVGKLMTDERLYTDLQQFVNAANEMARSVRAGKGTVGRLLNDPKAAEELERSLKNVEEITQSLNAGRGSLGKLLKDDTFSQTLTAATANIKEVTDKISHGDGTVSKLISDPALFNRLNSVTNRLDELVTKLNEGQGTAGQLLKDKQLYENMNKTVTEMQALLADIRKDPKKYLNVKVSIF